MIHAATSYLKFKVAMVGPLAVFLLLMAVILGTATGFEATTPSDAVIDVEQHTVTATEFSDSPALIRDVQVALINTLLEATFAIANAASLFTYNNQSWMSPVWTDRLLTGTVWVTITGVLLYYANGLRRLVGRAMR